MGSEAARAAVVLEPAAQQFADDYAEPPFLYQLDPSEGRRIVAELQARPPFLPGADVTDLVVAGPSGPVPVRIVAPPGAAGPLPVILYVHGLGWVFGGPGSHDRLVRELAVGVGAAVVYPDYSLSPEAAYPTALEEVYAVAQWIAGSGAGHGLDPARVAIAGDCAGGNLAAAVTLLAKQRGGVSFARQVLFYPVTDAAFGTGSYHEFAEGYVLRRDAMKWFWDQYTTDPRQRAEITASPLRATVEQLTGLPPALVVVAEADVLRDEGEAYAGRLRAAGVPVTAVRYQGVVHDFVALDALRGTGAAQAAITQAVAFLSAALH
ncbi:alpha/beta hydrolase [Dactylosporangium siamense]|uniref:Esterase n=1 Tax=Dactylosporangium siamense TaxID=685454 RepID=A0A919PIJ4_9ACTN|nr:alpha/beta hydrolase [Dactylosporangium siamense]GIG43866.1 esterase [Dactylosporangium siamense]